MGIDLQQFIPKQPEHPADLKIDLEIVTNQIMKELYIHGKKGLRPLSKSLRVHVNVTQKVINELKQAELVGMVGGSGVGADYQYGLYPKGTERAKALLDRDTYLGPVPVAFEEYIRVTKAVLDANKKGFAINKHALQEKFVHARGYEDVRMQIGQAVCARKPAFVFGFPGNGKTLLCSSVVRLLPPMVVPSAVAAAGHLVRIFDPSCHVAIESFDMDGLDERWVVVQPPLITAGGELTLADLEVVYNKKYGCFDAPPQVKATGGVLLIDDLGRQRCRVEELFNRFIVPLENKVDYLVLGGQRMEVPTDEIVLFSTNLDPMKIVDDAFLRRLPYKIHVRNPRRDEYLDIWKAEAAEVGLTYEPALMDHLFNLYRKDRRGLRAVHPRDLLGIIYDRKRFMEVEDTNIGLTEVEEAYRLTFVSGVTLTETAE